MSKFHIFSLGVLFKFQSLGQIQQELFGLDGNDLLLMWIIDAEGAHLMEWPEAQRSQLDTQIKDGDILRAPSQLLLQGKIWPDKKVNTKKYDDRGLQKYVLVIFLQQITALNL